MSSKGQLRKRNLHISPDKQWSAELGVRCGTRSRCNAVLRLLAKVQPLLSQQHAKQKKGIDDQHHICIPALVLRATAQRCIQHHT